jgi:hypothetical protein
MMGICYTQMKPPVAGFSAEAQQPHMHRNLPLKISYSREARALWWLVTYCLYNASWLTL